MEPNELEPIRCALVDDDGNVVNLVKYRPGDPYDPRPYWLRVATPEDRVPEPQEE